MVWGQKRAGVDDLVTRLRTNAGGRAMLLMSTRTFGDAEAASLCEALAENESLEELLCSGHSISPEGAKCFAEALRKNRKLKRLSLGCSNLGDAGLLALLEGWDNDSLEHLDLELKGLGPPSMLGLAQVLRSESHALQQLMLGRNTLGDEGAAALAAGLAASPSLHLIDLKSNGVGVDGSRALGAALALRAALPSARGLQLVLDDNPIGSAGVEALVLGGADSPASAQGSEIGVAPAIAEGSGGSCDSARPSAVAGLSLARCEVDDVGAAALGRALSADAGPWVGLETLNLSGNAISSGEWMTGALSVAASRLARLDLSRNALETSALVFVAAALSSRSQAGQAQLRALDISANKLTAGSDESRGVLADLAGRSGLEELRILGNAVGDEGAAAVAAALANEGSTMRVLSLAGTGLTFEGCKRVLEGLALNKSLRTLELGGNPLGDEGRVEVERFTAEVRPDLDIAVDKNMDGQQQDSAPPGA